MLFLVCCLLLAGNLALIWRIKSEVTTPPDYHLPRATNVAQSTPASPQVPDAFVMPDESAFAAVVQRPLFAPSRRAPSRSIDAPEAAPSELHAIVIGIVQSLARSFVLLRPSGRPEVVQVREGDSFEGWLLSQILPDRAIFTRDGEEIVLEIVFDIESPRFTTEKTQR